jgi:hypothetical protein
MMTVTSNKLRKRKKEKILYKYWGWLITYFRLTSFKKFTNKVFWMFSSYEIEKNDVMLT